MAPLSKKRKNGWPKGIFRDIFISSKPELSPFGTVFVFEAENIEEQGLGTIFGIIKIDDHSEDSSYITNLLVSVMKKEYFSKPHRMAEESFEASLRKANLALAELARHGSLGWSGKINFASGALERNNLHFSCLGGVSVHLLRGGQIVEIGQDFDEERNEEPHPLKTFSNISSGKLERNDKLVFATRDLAEVFSREELRQNATHFSREEFPGFLEMSLQANSELAGAIVIDLAEEPEIKHTIAKTRLIDKDKTLKHVDIEPAVMEQTMRDDSLVGFPKEKSSLASRTSVAENETHRSFWQKCVIFSKKTFAYIAKTARNFFAKLLSLFRRSSRKETRREHGAKDPISVTYHPEGKMRQWLANIKNKFQAFEPRGKKLYWGIFGGIAVIIIIVFAFVSAKNKKVAEPAPQPENIPAEVQTVLPVDDIEARKIENVEEFASLPQEESRIVLLENSLYAVSGKDKSMAMINLETKTVEEAKIDLPAGNFELVAAMPHLKTIFILTGDRKAVSFTPVNKNFQENNISLPGNLKSQDIRSYLTYLYVLDTANNQIYRYPRAEGGFGEGQNWLRAATDLKDAKSIAINDDLYVAENENISAYLQGKKDGKVNFESPQTLLSVDRIYSEPEMEFVWVLDNKNHRVIRFAKDGKISAQFFNESISDINDFAVDEKNKTVYLLEGNSINKFTFE